MPCFWNQVKQRSYLCQLQLQGLSIHRRGHLVVGLRIQEVLHTADDILP